MPSVSSPQHASVPSSAIPHAVNVPAPSALKFPPIDPFPPSMPSTLAPQHTSSPLLLRAQAWLSPVTTFSVVIAQVGPQNPAGQLQNSALSSATSVPPCSHVSGTGDPPASPPAPPAPGVTGSPPAPAGPVCSGTPPSPP